MKSNYTKLFTGSYNKVLAYILSKVATQYLGYFLTNFLIISHDKSVKDCDHAAKNLHLSIFCIIHWLPMFGSVF